jgi:hypothetical protein
MTDIGTADNPPIAEHAGCEIHQMDGPLLQPRDCRRDFASGSFADFLNLLAIRREPPEIPPVRVAETNIARFLKRAGLVLHPSPAPQAKENGLPLRKSAITFRARCRKRTAR